MNVKDIERLMNGKDIERLMNGKDIKKNYTLFYTVLRINSQ